MTGCEMAAERWHDTDAGKRRELEDRIAKHQQLSTAAKAMLEYHNEKANEARAELKLLNATCTHDWRYRCTGRHGSDKGDDYYRCALCGADRVES